MTSSRKGHSAWNPPEIGVGFSGGRSPETSGATLSDGEWTLPELEVTVQGRARPGQEPARRAEGDDSYDRGYADGMRDAIAQTEQRTRTAVEVLGQAAEALVASRAGFARDLQQNIHVLALATAKKIIQRELTTSPEIVRDLVSRAIELFDADSPMEIRLHPEDLESFRSDWEGFAPPERQGALQWLADPSLERGSFQIENPTRMVDGRIDVALRNLYERLEHE